MPEIKPDSPAERPDENPYAAPEVERTPAPDGDETDPVWSQRTKHLRRESCIRVTGLIGLIFAGFVLLAFGGGMLVEIFRQEEEGIELWMHRRWMARMIGVSSIAILAFVASLGLFRLQNWGRWTLTIMATLPVPAIVCAWLFENRTANPGVQDGLETANFAVLFVMSALSSPLLLFLMWSPRGQTVFSSEYAETIRQTPGSRPGCSGIFPALAAVFAELISCLVFLLTALSLLVLLGVIRSI